MSYNQNLEKKIESTVKRWQNLEKKKMFGGVCWLIKGNMAFGIWKDFLVVRMDKAEAEQSIKKTNCKPFDITGKVMAGWVMVKEAGWTGQAALKKWVNVGKIYALSLPEKKGKAKAKAKKTKTLREYKA